MNTATLAYLHAGRTGNSWGSSRVSVRKIGNRAGPQERGICELASKVMFLFVSLVATTILINPAAAEPETIDPAESGEQYAWGENIGWLNAEPLGNNGPGVTVFSDHLEGWMWSETIGWLSLSCANTNSCGQVDFGVGNDSSGYLSGLAWSENAGWISFSCSSTGSCGTLSYGVTISPTTGEFSGWAWSENLGWISFSCMNTGSCGRVGYGVKTAVPFLVNSIFSDGFETGDTTSWSNTVP